MLLHLPFASTLKACATVTLSLSVFAAAAQAGIAPRKLHMSREKVAEVCSKLGENGRGIGLDNSSGKYGCENLAGGSLLCEESGECKYYFYDPRTKWFKKDPQNPNKLIVIPRVRVV